MQEKHESATLTEFDRDCLRWRRRVLVGEKKHWCRDWDGLPVDETCAEFECCTCFDRTPSQ